MSLVRTAMDRFIGYCWGFVVGIGAASGNMELAILGCVGFMVTTTIAMIQAELRDDGK